MARIKGYKTFGDCPVHGEAIEQVFRTSLDDGSAGNVCKLCSKTPRVRPDGMPSFVKQEMSNVRTIQIVDRNGYGVAPKPCGGACTSGKRSCDCKCSGQCHGLGKCICVGE